MHRSLKKNVSAELYLLKKNYKKTTTKTHSLVLIVVGCGDGNTVIVDVAPTLFMTPLI